MRPRQPGARTLNHLPKLYVIIYMHKVTFDGDYEDDEELYNPITYERDPDEPLAGHHEGWQPDTWAYDPPPASPSPPASPASAASSASQTIPSPAASPASRTIPSPHAAHQQTVP